MTKSQPETPESLILRWRVRAADMEANHWLAAYSLRFAADELAACLHRSL